ncbi:coiled-coil domain-containing protein 186 [Stomoxys calcitrans]|uniref:coiled-coil domain-containing protein 186 n=1 Tax=Stomoxys calcitrans TaxID=35570 RepID=UPI0027E33DA0|nr:coiled-coil domain-containing protein 186 [Stomoxys calcitrans]
MDINNCSALVTNQSENLEQPHSTKDNESSSITPQAVREEGHDKEVLEKFTNMEGTNAAAATIGPITNIFENCVENLADNQHTRSDEGEAVVANNLILVTDQQQTSQQLGEEEQAVADVSANILLHTNTTPTTSPVKANDVSNVSSSTTQTITPTTETNTLTTSVSATDSPSIRFLDLMQQAEAVDYNVDVEKEDSVIQQQEQQQQQHSHWTEEVNKLKECQTKFQQQQKQYEQQLEQLQAALAQKDNMISLFQRENAILEKEKEAFRREKDLANKARESTVIQFAMKEKNVIDAKKEREAVEKQLAEAKKEIKNYTTKFQALNEEKSRIAYLMDEKCNEVRKYQRECEKLKTDYGHLESKLKYHMNKLNMETEAKLALEKKLEEERNAPNKLEEKANEKLKIEFEAQTILLKHEIANKTEHLEKLLKETEAQKEIIKQLQDQLKQDSEEKSQLSEAFLRLQDDHNQVQNSYSEEMLQSAKLRGQLDELQVLKTQNTLNEEKLSTLAEELNEARQRLQDNEQDLEQLHEKEKELLSFNREMSGSIVDMQNQICLLKSKAQGIEAENVLLKKERAAYDDKYAALEQQLKQEQNQKNEERLLLAKHLSEKTKLYENTKLKLENVQGDFEATKNKHNTIVKELQREIMKFKRSIDPQSANSCNYICSRCQQPALQQQSNGYHKTQEETKSQMEQLEAKRSHSRQSSSSTTVQSVSSTGSRRGSESSESDTVVTGRELDFKDENKGPSKKHLVERILRLQQASARQAEKIDFLEQHTLSLVAELQKKSKVVQHYMLRDQAGALTSSKSDQNKSELAKYGNGVMSAIYGGIKGVENKSMSLELSLEINKKLQAVLEDTLLKNITLKENLDVLGLEVDNLTRKLRQMEAIKR